MRALKMKKEKAMTAFQELVSAATSPNSDLEKSITGLMLFAEANAKQEDISVFMEWLDEKTMLGAIVTAITTPGDHFECAEGKTWGEMELYYDENRPVHQEPHW